MWPSYSQLASCFFLYMFFVYLLWILKYLFNTENSISVPKISNPPPFFIQLLIIHPSVEINHWCVISTRLGNPGIDGQWGSKSLWIVCMVNILHQTTSEHISIYFAENKFEEKNAFIRQYFILKIVIIFLIIWGLFFKSFSEHFD